MPQVPLGVKLVAILVWVAGAFTAILGISAFLIASGTIPVLQQLGWADAGSRGMLAFGIAGAAFLIVAAMHLVTGVGLWRGRNWARILTIIFTALEAIISLTAATVFPLWGAPWVVINGGIAFYLLFSGNVKRAFNAN